jgi:hypothetical protein
MNISRMSHAWDKKIKKKWKRDETMKKQFMKHYVGTLLTGFLFVLIPSVLVAAQQHETAEDTQKGPLQMMTNLPAIHEIQLILLKQTTESTTNTLQIQQEKQTRMTNLPMDKQTSVPNGEFYTTPSSHVEDYLKAYSNASFPPKNGVVPFFLTSPASAQLPSSFFFYNTL